MPRASARDGWAHAAQDTGSLISRPASLLTSPEGLKVQFGPEDSTTLGKADLNQTTTFQVAVSAPGLYPVRFMNFGGHGGTHADWYSIDALGAKHLVNDRLDAAAFKTPSSIRTGPAPTISINQSGAAVIIQCTGVLQSSTTLGTFTDVPGATSPYTVPLGAPRRLYFRARPSPDAAPAEGLTRSV